MAIAGGIASSAMAASKAKKQANTIAGEEGVIGQQYQDNNSIINQKRYQDVTERAETVGAMRKMQEMLNRQGKADAARAAVTGETASSQIAAMEARNSATANSMAELAERSAILKDSWDQQKIQNNNQYYRNLIGVRDKIAGVYGNQAAQLSTAANNLYHTAGNLAGPLAGSIGGATGGTTPQAPEKPTTQQRDF